MDVEQATVSRFWANETQVRWSAETRNIALLVVLTVLAAVFSCVHIYSKHLNGPPIRSDGFGYYAYLPSVFIDHSLELSSALKNMPEGATSYAVGINPVNGTGRNFNKYAVGTALLQSPFFLSAHVLAGVAGEPQTGYSRFYQIANTVSAISYLCIGMIFLFYALRSSYSAGVSLVTVALSVFGTNVFHYATYDASFSHVYQFALTSILLYLLMTARRSGARPRRGWVVAVGVVTGLIALTRMTNAPFALLTIAFFVERWSKDRDLKAFVADGLLAGACVLLVLFPQLLYWKHLTGHWLVNAYTVVGEDAKFFWTHPALLDFLFSIRKGALLWTPLLILGVIGLPALARRQGMLGWAMILVLALHVYICASWYCWPFGGSFGSRPMVDVMPIFAISAAMIVNQLATPRRVAMLTCLVAALVLLNWALMYSYWHGFIPFDETDLATLLKLPARLRAEF
ncbi:MULTISPECIES: hypothetical protein [unclassified Dyella]|uniref:hypothetical protein n=1 Tax=unclassified Dyella TaxID=2634549 RepID=UPI000CC70539|nr:MULTISPECIES: hypothetical protein [unclassified Dyella]MDR3444388.1 hypothetical protein [Dyella sp.]PMQ06029.1 hypothetical protein DyAD56_07195 [Dyella sp. AD56]